MFCKWEVFFWERTLKLKKKKQKWGKNDGWVNDLSSSSVDLWFIVHLLWLWVQIVEVNIKNSWWSSVIIICWNLKGLKTGYKTILFGQVFFLMKHQMKQNCSFKNWLFPSQEQWENFFVYCSKSFKSGGSVTSSYDVSFLHWWSLHKLLNPKNLSKFLI